MKKKRIMKKKSLFVLVSASILFGMTIISCSNNEESSLRYNSEIEPVYMYSDYLRDAKGETATLHYESWLNIWYLLDKNECRYYVFTHDNESNDKFRSLMEEGVIVDGASVIFDGKVYGTTDEWRENMTDYLAHLGNQSDVLRDNQWTLPLKSDWLQSNSEDKAFVLMVPFNIKRVE